MTAFVLGNGVSRQAVSIFDLSKAGAVYGCNALYREYTPAVLVATDRPIAEQIQNSGYAKTQRFYTRKPLEGLGALPVPQKYYGFSSGPIALAIAAQDSKNPIYLLGFDMGPNQSGQFNNVYANTEFYKPAGALPTYTGNWVRQIISVMKDFPNIAFIRVYGETTAEVPEFAQIKNFQKMALSDFLERINKPKDL